MTAAMNTMPPPAKSENWGGRSQSRMTANTAVSIAVCLEFSGKGFDELPFFFRVCLIHADAIAEVIAKDDKQRTANRGQQTHRAGGFRGDPALRGGRPLSPPARKL